jgi:hemoglobin
MAHSPALLEALGGAEGCRRLSTEFYGRVQNDAVLHPFFPGKSVRCAIEQFAAFLIQFLGGAEDQAQDRWWLSLRESHARFQIGPAERRAWLKHMDAALKAVPLDETARRELRDFFRHSSAYIEGSEVPPLEHGESADRWAGQLVLDNVIDAITSGGDPEALRLAPRFVSRPAVFVGILARMCQSSRPALVAFAVQTVEQNPALAAQPYGGHTLLHYASAAGCLDVVTAILRLGADPSVKDSGGHTPLYSVANGCPSAAGPRIVQALVRAGADVNASCGVTRATPLHMAARRGHLEIARTLLDCGAALEARDSKGDTPLDRARNCRRDAVAHLFLERGAAGQAARR